MLPEIVARLREQIEPPTLITIGGMGSLASLPAAPPAERQPAAYVFPIACEAGPNQRANGVLQVVSVTFGVYLLVTNRRDATGAAAIEDVEPVYEAVRAALIGWAPTSGHGAITYVSGDIIGDPKGGAMKWLEVFATDMTISA